MVFSNTRYIIYAGLLLSLLSISAIVLNLFVYHFPGNNYLPYNTRAVAYSLFLVYGGCLLQFGKASQQIKILNEVIFYYVVIALIAIATNAAQYTPFPVIDKKILAFESTFHINMNDIMSWTYTKPLFKRLLTFSYTTLPYQIAYFPLIVIATRRWQYIREYYFLLIISAIIGFSFYYFFPTTAPASIISNQYFTEEQHATGLKFTQIHQGIQPSTLEGGMISLPSFHVIWAWFCLYILRGWPIGFIIMLPINLLLVAACVLLGWHYLIDILGGIIVILMSHALYYLSKIHTLRAPRKESPMNVLALNSNSFILLRQFFNGLLK